MRLVFLAVVAVLAVLLAQSAAADVPLVELKTAGETYRGRVVARDASTALLLDRDGVMCNVPLARVTDFRVAEADFRPYDVNELKRRLKELAGRDVTIFASRHFVVAGRSEPARKAALALEEVHDQYRYFCSTHNLPLSDPEFPLVAIVMPDHQTFVNYCVRDGVPPSPGLGGYYLETTNRFVCYERGATRDDPIAGVRDTLTHEAVHQLAFNTGLHARMGTNPTWIVEGLATTLEPEGIRRPYRSQSLHDRVNPERFFRFLQMVGKDGTAPVSGIVASDRPFDTCTLPSYATAWAMTYYLLETRPGDYLNYLRKLSARSPLADYTSEERLKDFRDSFGRDIERFERDLADYMRRVASGKPR